MIIIYPKLGKKSRKNAFKNYIKRCEAMICETVKSRDSADFAMPLIID